MNYCSMFELSVTIISLACYGVSAKAYRQKFAKRSASHLLNHAATASLQKPSKVWDGGSSPTGDRAS